MSSKEMAPVLSSVMSSEKVTVTVVVMAMSVAPTVGLNVKGKGAAPSISAVGASASEISSAEEVETTPIVPAWV